MEPEYIPEAQELRAGEYFDLWWQRLSQNPADNISVGGVSLLIVVIVSLLYLFLGRTRKTP
jgi:hypothetical protein